MDFRLLGPLEVVSRGEMLPLGGQRQRGLLALLLLHANEAVHRDRLIDAVWGESPPATVASALTVYISRLRKLLAVDGTGELVRRSHGYLLRVEPETIDAHRFERGVEEGAAALAGGDSDRAAALLRDALALWRGPALADLDDQPFVRAEVTRLEELRVVALEKRIEADLALGRHTALVPELEALVREHPYRERLRAHSMLALYRCGRQAEALATYRDARRRFVDELGIEPGPELQRLERAILEHDPKLDAPPIEPSEPPARAPRPGAGDRRDIRGLEPPLRRRPMSRKRWIVIAAVVTVAAVAVAFAAASREDTGLAGLSPNSVGLIDPETAKVVREIPIGERPVALDAAGGTLWVANYADDSVTRIDERTGAADTIPVGGHPTALEADGDGAWVLQSDDRRLVRIDREFGYRAGMRVRLEATALAASGSSLWVTQGGTTLQRLDAAGRPRGDPLLMDRGATTLVAFEGKLWVAGPRALTAVDAKTGIPSSPIALLDDVTAIAAGAGYVWVTVGGQGSETRFLQKIDPERERAAAFQTLGSAPGAVAVARGYVWVATADGTVARLRADNLTVAGVVDVGARPSALASGEAGVWVAVE